MWNESGKRPSSKIWTIFRNKFLKKNISGTGNNVWIRFNEHNFFEPKCFQVDGVYCSSIFFPTFLITLNYWVAVGASWDWSGVFNWFHSNHATSSRWIMEIFPLKGAGENFQLFHSFPATSQTKRTLDSFNFWTATTYCRYEPFQAWWLFKRGSGF